MPANAGVQDRDACCLQRLGQLDHFRQRGAPLDQVQHGQTKDQDEIGADLGTGSAHDFQRKADAVLVTSAPGVVTVVGVGGDKFIDQVALRAHDLHAIVAGALCQGRGAHKVFDGLLHLFGAQRMRAKGVDRRFDGARRDQFGVVGVAAKVQYLHADLAAGFVHRLRHHLVFFGFFGRRHASATGHGASPIVGGNPSGHHQGHAASRALCIKRGHALKAVLGFFQADMHRAHQHAVFQYSETQVQRTEHQGVSGHGALSENTTTRQCILWRGASLGQSGRPEDCFMRQRWASEPAPAVSRRVYLLVHRARHVSPGGLFFSGVPDGCAQSRLS